MGMLLRTVDEDEVRAPDDARLSDDEFEEIINNILGKESPSAKRLENRLRSKGETERDIYAWGIEDEDVYKQVMDGDPMIVAVGSGNDPSDYEIKYVTELEFCLHEDVCEDCGEDLSEVISGENDDYEYFAFSTVVPMNVSESSSDSSKLNDIKNFNHQRIAEAGDIFIRDRHEDKNSSERLVNQIIYDEGDIKIDEKDDINYWDIATGDSDNYWSGEDYDTFPECNKAYAGGYLYDELPNKFENTEVGDVIIARRGKYVGDTEILGVGIVQSEPYNGYVEEGENYKPVVDDIEESGDSNEFALTVDWIVKIDDKSGGIKIEETMEGKDDGEQIFNRGSLNKCGIDTRNQVNRKKYEYLKSVACNVDDEDMETKFSLLEEKAEHKKALHQKLEEHRMKHKEVKEYRDLLEKKKQVLFYGPPGTGKTYTAEKIPEVIDKYDEDRTEFVTFHPSYSYEEFVQGIRPVTDSEDDDSEDDDSEDDDSEDDDGELGYEVKGGVFKELCEDAQGNPGKKYLLVIDEVNRGNISSIFGELITLLEGDKRGDPENDGEEATKVSLPYSDHEDDDEEDFWVPNNLHIIGTMNTADRSIAKLDVALRRRFAHDPFEPDIEEFAKEEFEDYDENDVIGDLREKAGFKGEDYSEEESDPVALSALAIREINERLMEDFDVEAGKKIGHSYMMNIEKEKEVLRTWKYEILPLLNEYFFDEYGKIAELLSTDDEGNDGVGNIVDTEMKKFEEFDWGDLEPVLKRLADKQGDSD